MWLRSWAFATSPYGLSLSTDRYLDLTPRELAALIKIYEGNQRRWAFERAQFSNAHFRGQHDPPFEPAHFLGTKDYAASRRQTMKEQIEVAAANAALARIKPGEMPDDLPSWARG